MGMQWLESQQGIGKFRDDPDKLKADLAKMLSEGAKKWREAYREIPLTLEEVPLPYAEPIVWAVRDLNRSNLVERERESLRAFFGQPVAVAQVPDLLVETYRVAQDEGFSTLAPIYLPATEFEQRTKYPGWKVKPEKWYWEQIRTGKVNKDAAKLAGVWGLFDESQRPNYAGGRQLFDDDALAPILQRLRREGRIQVLNNTRQVPETSRFGVSAYEQDQFVFPQLAMCLRLVDRVKEGVTQLRRTTEMEFNFAGNLRYPHLGQANTLEWLDDKFGCARRLVGGHSGGGGLAFVYYGWSGGHDGGIGFRPLIVFSPQAR